MFGDVAVELLKLMGRSGTIPGALTSEDIPQALTRLKEAISEKEAETTEITEDDQESEDEFIDQPVSLRNRAFPLIEMLEAARAEDVPVMWEPK